MPRLLMRRADEIWKTIRSDGRYGAILENARETVAYWEENFNDDPSRIGGWGHHFVCPDCGNALRYDRTASGEHRCPACGKAHRGADIESAWVEARRNDIADTLGLAAILWRLEGGEGRRAHILRVVGWYAGHYAEFEEHGRWVGSAKAMGHTLSEAIWGIRLIEALMLANVDPNGAEAQGFKKRLFVPLLRLILSQPTKLMNISLWHAAYMMAVCAYYMDPWLMRPYIGYERNGANLILTNVTGDGIWRENSISYHFYALSAALEYATFLKCTRFPDDELGRDLKRAFTGGGEAMRTLRRAYAAPLSLMFPNGDLPATNDGWKTSLASVRHQYFAAYRLFEGSEEAPLFAAALREAGEAEPSMDTLLYGSPESGGALPPRDRSVHFARNKLAMLRNGRIDACVKYGNLCGGHSHPDALELMIHPFSVDPGSIAYGLPIHGEYYYVGASHSTFMVDGLNQCRTASGVGEMEAGGAGFRAEVTDAYPGVRAGRAVRLEGARLADRMEIVCDGERVIDWIFHGSGEFRALERPIGAGDLRADLPEGAGTEPNGYGHFKGIAEYAPCDVFECEWAFEGRKLSLRLRAEDAKVFTAETPDNPPTRIRNAVVVRARGVRLVVCAEFEVT